MNISTWIDRPAAHFPNKTAIWFGSENITYRVLEKRITRLAGVLKDALDIGHGERVAYLGKNHPDMIALLFACARIGAILMPLNWRLAVPECQIIMWDCTPKVLVVGPGYEAQADRISKHYKIPLIPPESLSCLLDAAKGLPASEGKGALNDPVLICYTSGATGTPKGVVLDQRSLEVNALNSTHMHNMTAEDVVLTTLPMFHVGGLNIQTLPVLHLGGSLVLHPAFDVTATYTDLVEKKVTLTVLVPTQLGAMIANPSWKTADLGNLRMISTGSTMVPLGLIKKVHARGVPLIQVYGSTETCPIAICQTAEFAMTTEGSAGKPALHCEMRIVDEGGQDIVAGLTGEILIRGRNVMCRYWNAPDKTAGALENGWFHTGDMGHVDENGFLYVDDRKKDMIISGGENIYPAEVESVLADCPGISEAAVVGQADEKWGEVVVAVAVKSGNFPVSSSDIDAYLKDRLAVYKHPHRVVFLDVLPRNVMGKVIKDDLRKYVNETTQNTSSEAAS